MRRPPVFDRENTSIGLLSDESFRDPSDFTGLEGSLPSFPEAQEVTETVPTDFDSQDNNILSAEQHDVVNLARANMSDEQRREVDERMKKARVDDGMSSAESQDEAGPSKDKGKGTDPRNWGNLDFLSDEVDPEVQRQIMQACNDIMHENKKKLHVSIDVPEEPNESEAVVEETIENENPREDLKKKLRLQKQIKNALRKRDKNIKKESKKDKAHRAASEPLSHELEEMIGQLTDINKKISVHQSKEKLRDTNRLDPVNQITKDSALG
ncbi:hypothetical protein H0H92_004978 [Tricholoma furcatifolium]|nr:hypothetical protein H0H92_004978 [Tricholoma furcatifolium]